MITGDYSGDTTQSLYKEQVTNYTVIKKMLNLNDGQIKIKPNPRLEKNQTLVNTIFQFYPVQVCPVKARPFIFDAENVKKRADGTIVKNDRNDPAQQADVLDLTRYWFNMFMGKFAENYFNAPQNYVKEVTPKVIPIVYESHPDYGDVGHDAIYAIEQGNTVVCTKFEYHQSVRSAILKQANKWVDYKDAVRAQVALMEVKRLDEYFSKM